MARKLRVEYGGAIYPVRYWINRLMEPLNSPTSARERWDVHLSHGVNHLMNRGDRRDASSAGRGWCLGGEAFRKELVEAMEEKLGAEHYGEEKQETAVAKAERIVMEELKKRRWQPAVLEQRPKGDPEKVKIAQRMRCETTMTLAWIAQRLGMGTKTHLAHLLYWSKRDKTK
jgi:hypothetical protein